MKIKADNLGLEIEKVIKSYSDDVIKSTKEVAKEVASESVKKLKSSSPKNTGKYAKSWKSTTKVNTSNRINIVVHAGRYQLTHLLEKGHVIKNGTGRVYGKVKAHPHIEKVENEVISDFENKLKEKIEHG